MYKPFRFLLQPGANRVYLRFSTNVLMNAGRNDPWIGIDSSSLNVRGQREKERERCLFSEEVQGLQFIGKFFNSKGDILGSTGTGADNFP